MTNDKDPNKDANNMGGPSFHPDVAKKAAKEEPVIATKDTAILDKDQVPPL